MTAALAVEDLTVAYSGGRTAVRDVSFDIGGGEVVALVGESGCGKSTIAKALLGLLPGSARVSGSARLGGSAGQDDLELVGRAEREWAGVRGSRIAIIPQGAMAGLNPVHRVRSQLAEMIRLHTDLTGDAVTGRVAKLIEDVRLDHAALRAYPHELSGGMRQRVAIALALAGNPGVIVADEPTTGLDALTQEHVLHLLGEVRERTGVTMLVVSHDLPALVRQADRVAVMYAGRIVEIRDATAMMSTTTPSGNTVSGVVASSTAASRAAHPYTAGLLAASAAVDLGTYWKNVPGSAPPLDAELSGCRFAPRCPLAVDRCQEEEPLLLPHAGALVACHRTGDADHPEYPHVPRAGDHVEGSAPLLRVRGIRHTFRNRRGSVDALCGVDLEIAPGEILGLVGESGSGKSTLTRIILGLINPSAGQVELAGTELTRRTGRALRAIQRRVGFVHQDPYGSLHPALRVATIVGEPLAIARVPRAERSEPVKRALTAVWLPTDEEFLARFPAQLSGGQRQRVAVARALVRDPVLLVADEATSMLDVSARAGIAITLRRLATERGLAVLLVTHDLGEAVQSCDRIMVLRHGAVVECGPPARLVGEPEHDYTAELLNAASHHTR